MKYRRKPEPVDAVQYDGTDKSVKAIEALGFTIYRVDDHHEASGWPLHIRGWFFKCGAGLRMMSPADFAREFEPVGDVDGDPLEWAMKAAGEILSLVDGRGPESRYVDDPETRELARIITDCCPYNAKFFPPRVAEPINLVEE